MARAVTTTTRAAAPALTRRMPLPPLLVGWWPAGHGLPTPAGLALLADVLAPSSIPYDEMQARRRVLVPELVEALKAAVASIEEELAEPATVSALVEWMRPLNEASGNPVEAAELVRRATAMLDVLPNLPAAVLVPETRCLLRGDYTPNLEGVRVVAERAVSPRRRLLAKVNQLIRLAPPAEEFSRRPEPVLRGDALLRHARKLMAASIEAKVGLGSMQAQARVLVAHAKAEDPDRAVAVAGILAPLVDRVLPKRRFNAEAPGVDPHTPLRVAKHEPLPSLNQLLPADALAKLRALPVPGGTGGGGGGGTRREDRA